MPDIGRGVCCRLAWSGMRGGPWSRTAEHNNEQSRLIFEAIQASDSSWLAQVMDGVALEQSS